MTDLKNVPFQPVMLGTDIGAYGILRSFHDLTGKKGIAVTHAVYGPISHSRILEVEMAGSDPTIEKQGIPALIEGLLEVGPKLMAKYPDRPLVLMANIDSNIWDIVQYREELSKYYTFAFPPLETIEKTNDKAVFPQLAQQFQMSVPPTMVLDLDQGVAALEKKLEEFPHEFPWILKPTMGYGYERLHWPGKSKVYTVHNRQELREVLTSVEKHTAGHPRARHFVAQPRIEGNDTYNLSITAYVDSRGKVTMLGSAQVLLEDHSPTALGNPAAMITEPYPGLYEQAIRFLEGVKWHGFANFDVKVDRKTKQAYFFEVNPRIGRNSYYNTAAGMNPMEFLIRDLLLHQEVKLRTIPSQIYYSVLPKRLVTRYLDKRMRQKVNRIHRQGKVTNPILNPDERDFSLRALKRELYVRLSTFKHWIKFHKNYPKSVFQTQGSQSFDTSALRNS